jgi:hypothetical protein
LESNIFDKISNIEKNLLKNKTDILGQINKDNENIYKNICENAGKLEISIDKINLELVSHKNISLIKKKEFNKQKILSEISKMINRINNIITELNFIRDFLNSLNVSNCKNLLRMEKKFEYASNLAPEIIENIQNEINNKKYKINVSLLS